MRKLPSFLFLFLLILSGCGDGSSTPILHSDLILIPDRPSTAAIILSRAIDYKTDNRISYCEVLSTDNRTYSGFRDQELYPLASLSKVITTAWALKKLGPDYTFQSAWYLKSISKENGLYDVYLKTNYDPVFNIEKILYSISLLHQHGVVKIRNLIIDETTRVYLSVLSQPHLELENVPISSSETLQNLELILNSNNWSSQTQAAKEKLQVWAAAKKQNLQWPDHFSVEHVELKKSEDIHLEEYSQTIYLRSSTLIKYLKNLNVYSNNYVADALFSYLGGASEFKKFQKDELKLLNNQLQFLTGSGLASTTYGLRQDNEGSCLSLLKVFNYIDRLARQQGLNMGHFLYNPAQDLDGTFDTKMNFSNQIVFKTGRLFENPALNLAGIISTPKGSLYFSFLGHNFSENQSDEIEKARDSILQSALNYYETTDTFLSLNDYQILLQ